jgi:hypothetical protein
MLLRGSESSAPFHTFEQRRARDIAARKYLICGELFGGPDRDRTDDLFHAIPRLNYRRLSTYEPVQPAKLPPWALFAHNLPQISGSGPRADLCGISLNFLFRPCLDFRPHGSTAFARFAG